MSKRNGLRCFDFPVRPEYFGNTPGLCNTADGAIRDLRFVDFTNAAKTCLAQSTGDGVERLRGSIGAAIDIKAGVEIRTQKPRPHDALVICGIPIPLVATVDREIVGIARRKG